MKKTILIITYLNRFLMIATVLLYITVILGLYSQIVLGAFQVISSLIILLFLKHLQEKEKKRLMIYFVMTVGFFLGWYLISEVFKVHINNQFKLLALIILLPMSIALYFTSIIEKIKNSIQ